MTGRIRYRRLPGRKMGFLRCPSAWLAEDHILLVAGTRFRETYQRVYLRDVQALLIRRKHRFVMQWPYVLPLPYVLAAMFGLLPARFAFPIIAVAALAVLLITILSLRFGCHLYLATAVGNVYVRSAAFTWTARRFAKKVTPAIARAQQPAETEAGAAK